MDFSKAFQERGFTKSSGRRLHRLMLIGKGGTGKTLLLSSLPGPKIGYLFDPNAQASIPSEIEDYQVRPIQPEYSDIDMGITAGFKRTGSGQAIPIRISNEKIKPRIMKDWADEIQELHTKGVWRDLGEAGGWLILDSVTYMSHYTMYEILYAQHKEQAVDARVDYNILGRKMTDFLLYCTSLPCNVACSGHYKITKEEYTSKITQEMDQYGQATRRIPTMMTDIFHTDVEQEGGRARFYIHTVPDSKTNSLGRKSISLKDLGDKQEVTIKQWNDLSKVGLAPYFNRKG